jgi:hypothetical protein
MAAELAGVTVADSISIGGSDVPLAGMGIRKKFVIKVYVASLYMAGNPSDAGEIISTDTARALRMNFLYKEVGVDSLQGAWKDGFEGNTPEPSEDLKKRMDQFVNLFSSPAMKGDEYLISYEPGKGTTISLKGADGVTIPGADFASAVFAIWFGDKPADKGLKKKVLKGVK